MGKGKINHEADGKLRVKEGISTQAHILNQSYVVGSSCTWLQSARYDPVVRWLWKRHTKREKERERERKRERERDSGEYIATLVAKLAARWLGGCKWRGAAAR
jgi:hypothetical protein